MEARKLEDYTYQDYLDIDATTKERVELIFGKIYMMAGASAVHQDVVGNIFYVLKNINKCKPRIAPYDLKLFCPRQGVRESTNVVQPDIMLFCESEQLPCAIFEVLSPSTAAKDKTVKKELYECAKIREYFLVEPEYGIVEKFVLDGESYRYEGSFTKEDTIDVTCLEAKLEVADFFAGIEVHEGEECD